MSFSRGACQLNAALIDVRDLSFRLIAAAVERGLDQASRVCPGHDPSSWSVMAAFDCRAVSSSVLNVVSSSRSPLSQAVVAPTRMNWQPAAAPSMQEREFGSVGGGTLPTIGISGGYFRREGVPAPSSQHWFYNGLERQFTIRGCYAQGKAMREVKASLRLFRIAEQEASRTGSHRRHS